jgi:hypothetical protein
MTEHLYTDIKFSGDYVGDGEYFVISGDFNGVSIPVLTLYVGDKRELWQEATEAGNAPAEEPAEAPSA